MCLYSCARSCRSYRGGQVTFQSLANHVLVRSSKGHRGASKRSWSSRCFCCKASPLLNMPLTSFLLGNGAWMPSLSSLSSSRSFWSSMVPCVNLLEVELQASRRHTRLRHTWEPFRTATRGQQGLFKERAGERKLDTGKAGLGLAPGGPSIHII